MTYSIPVSLVGKTAILVVAATFIGQGSVAFAAELPARAVADQNRRFKVNPLQ